MNRLAGALRQLLTDLRDLARREPALTRAAVAFAVGAVAAPLALNLFGVDLDEGQAVAWVLTVLGLTTGQGVATRRKVTPTADLLDGHRDLDELQAAVNQPTRRQRRRDRGREWYG